jgi:RNA recognition motif-containing protein
MFSAYGEVEDAFILKDQFKRSKGFGFVTFTNDSDADTAIAEMHEKEVGGRPLIVNEARPQQPRS